MSSHAQPADAAHEQGLAMPGQVIVAQCACCAHRKQSMCPLVPTFSHTPPPCAYGFQTQISPAAHSHAVAADGQGSTVLVVVNVVEVAACRPRNRLLAEACTRRRRASLLRSPSLLGAISVKPWLICAARARPPFHAATTWRNFPNTYQACHDHMPESNIKGG